MKIAIIGTGISGLGAAYLLQGGHDIAIYEPNAYIGGHSRTIDVRNGDRTVPVDTGFIVFNHRNYPHLTGMFRHLDVETIPSNMSFGASIANGWLEYGSMGMLVQKKNILRPQFWGMLKDILRFNRQALPFIEGRPEITLRQCMEQIKMGDWFKRYYLQAMGAAIWSCSVETILDYPAQTFLRFFENHGLLTVNQQPQWHTVKGGSREYVSKITAGFRNKIRLSCAVTHVRRVEGGVIVEDDQGRQETFDHVIFACHADTALHLLGNAEEAERDILGAFGYQKNKVIVHNDVSFMPQHRKCWSSWVYLTENEKDKSPVVSLSYWMNNLQSLQTEKPLIITLNPGRRPAENLILDEYEFDHPVFTLAAINAQRRIGEIQGRGGIWHCGAYQRYGFHEGRINECYRSGGKTWGDSAMDVTPRILTGKVMHKRFFPKVNAFTYGIYNIIMPLAHLDDAAIAVDRPAPLSFYRRDHGARKNVDLQDWAREQLAAHDIQVDGETILMTLPRVLGYVFNPVSFWFCHDREGLLRAVICEVNNTFGETHSYICTHSDQRPILADDWMGGEKLFHVSPFLPRQGHYRFRFALKDDAIGIWIDHYAEDGRLQLATAITGRTEPMTKTALRRVFWRYPMVTVKAIMLIHWQAIRLLAKGIGYIPKPRQRNIKISQIHDITKM